MYNTKEGDLGMSLRSQLRKGGWVRRSGLNPDLNPSVNEGFSLDPQIFVSSISFKHPQTRFISVLCSLYIHW